MPTETDAALRSGCLKRLAVSPFTVGPIYDSSLGDNPVKLGQFVSNTEEYTGLISFQLGQNRFATISSAVLHLKFSGSYSGSYSPIVVAVAADNQGWPATAAEASVFYLNTTTSSTPISPPSVGLNSVDITPQVQEIVNRTGWVPNNKLMIFISWSATGQGGFFATDNDTTNGPWLVVTGTGGDAGGGGGIGPGGQSGTNASFLLTMIDEDRL